MKIRDLRRNNVAIWPPSFGGSYHPGQVFPGPQEGTLRGVRQTQLGGVPMLALDMDHADDQYSGVLHWDEPPSLRRVSEILHAHVGEPVRAVGDLLISGFYGAELRPHIREMLRDGSFPRVLPPGIAIQRAEAGRVTPTSIVIRTTLEETCDPCGDYGPQVSYPQSRRARASDARHVRIRVERRAAAAIEDRRTQESGGAAPFSRMWHDEPAPSEGTSF